MKSLVFILRKTLLGWDQKKPLSSVLSFRKGFIPFGAGETLSGACFQLLIRNVMSNSSPSRREAEVLPLYSNTVNNSTSDIRACSFPSHFCSSGLAKEKGS